MQLEAEEIPPRLLEVSEGLDLKASGKTSGAVWAEPGTGAVLDA